MNLLLAAQSGWGKSFKAQHVMEQNIPEYERVVVLDYKDEYRGLAKAGLAKWWIVGPKEQKWNYKQWQAFVEQNKKVVLARHSGEIDADDWMEIATAVVQAARNTGEVLIVIDEAHFVAPQDGKVPKPIWGLATTGRGEGASSLWISQRLSMMEKDVTSQCQARLLGGFEEENDLKKVGDVVEYPRELHNPQVRQIPRTPEALKPSGRDAPPDSLQKFENEAGHTIGSEWIYSDNSGERRRLSTRGLAEEMVSTHYGKQGKPIKV